MCVAGARWVQDEILTKYPDADLRVYTVWLPVYATDDPSAWDENLLTDRRVTHYWDEKRLVGSWLLEHGNLDGEGTVYNAYWDRFVIYSPKASWESNGFSEAAQSTGAPIIDGRDTFLATLGLLLGK